MICKLHPSPHGGLHQPFSIFLRSQSITMFLALQLNLGVAGSALPNNAFGPGTGTTRLIRISCLGTEAKWEACGNAVWAETACNNGGDVAVMCSGNARKLSAVLVPSKIGASGHVQHPMHSMSR